ncbi:MAG TPA: saccharopine dehydrogenase NADP-binding domain-containing protein [Gemmatimonadales bacterium]|nr:saccharopine dehydrogenase NADP-binding domain-containing protein [Gemmatimonadales bacterium]
MTDLSFLLYGASGYTGRLAAEHAVARGLRPVLAGRSREKVEPLARSLGLEWRTFDLGSPSHVRDGIRNVPAVLHAAGPFSATSRPMVDACLEAGIHYIDITGEIDVFEAIAARDAEARDAGVMLLPGAGFDVVPSDCLAAHVRRRLPDATRLRLSFRTTGGISRGTARTSVEGMGRGTRVRRGGRIVELGRTPRATVDFGSGLRPAVGLSWGDVATAWYSTGIPDIEVFFGSSRRLALVAALPRPIKRLLATRVGRGVLATLIEKRMAPGPTSAERARTGTVIVAEAWNEGGGHVASRLRTAEAYTLTAWTAVEIARRASSGSAGPGYQTPSTAYGADFILAFEGSAREDL